MRFDRDFIREDIRAFFIYYVLRKRSWDFKNDCPQMWRSHKCIRRPDHWGKHVCHCGDVPNKHDVLFV